MISDRGAAFASNEFSCYCTQHNIHHILITTGLSRANGQVERLNLIIIKVLANLSIDKPENWYRQVPKVQIAINSSYQRTIDMTPFKLVYGVEMNHLEFQPIKKAVELEYVKWHEDQHEGNRQLAKKQIL